MTKQNSTTDTAEETRVYEKGTWQADLDQSTVLLNRAGNAKKKASSLLWNGAKAGINEWFPTSATDASGEALYSEVLSILGTARKGDASKIRTVALAVRNKGLDLDAFPNLSKAYAEAVHLTRTAREQEAEDDAAEEAIASIEAPKTATSEEGAAKILLSKGVDGAVVAILDALGAGNEAAHRSFLRAVSAEISARVQAKADAAKKAKADAAKADKAEQEAKKAAAPAKKTAAKKAAAPVATKAKPKAKPKQAEPVEEPVEEPVDDLDALLDDEPTPAPVPVKKKAAVKKAAVRRPAR